MIGGDAGIGKTRLLQSFLDESRSGRSKTIVATECLLRGQAALAPVLQLSAALDAFAGDTSGIGDAPPQNQTALFETLFRKVAAAASKRAILFVIDDLQWADQSTLDFVAWIAARVAALRVLIVVTHRSDALCNGTPFFEAAGAIARHAVTASIALEGLALSEIGTIAQRHIRAPATADVLLRIARRSAGNPFFAQALAKQYDETGDLSNLPLSVRAALSARVATLDAAAQRVLTHASVVGPHFELQTVADVSGIPMGAVRDSMRSALDAYLVKSEQRGTGYSFYHPLVQQTIYESLLPEERQAIHGRVLLALQAGGDERRHVEELADHAYAAGDSNSIRQYGELAGEAVLRMGAASQACDYFERAIAVATSSNDRADLTERLGYAQQTSGDLARSIPTWRSLLQMRIALNHWDEAARILGYLVGDLMNHTGSADSEPVDRFLYEYGSHVSVGARSRLLAFMASAMSALGRFDDATRYADSIANVTELPGTVRQNYLRAKLTVHSVRGEEREWHRAAREALDLAARIDDAFLSAIVCSGVAATALYMNARQELDEALAVAQKLARSRSMRGLEVYLRSLAATRAVVRGDVGGARHHALAVLADDQVAVARQALATCGVTIGLHAGDPDLAAAAMAQFMAADFAEFTGSDGAQILAQRAQLISMRGDHEAARQTLREAVRRTTLSDPSSITVVPVAVEHLPIAEAGELLDSAPDLPLENVAARASQHLAKAILAARRGRIEERIAHARLAADLCARLGWRLFEERARTIERAGVTEPFAPHADGTTTREERALWEALSAREREVAFAVAEGLNNRAIADQLSVSSKTIEKHVASIFRKWGVGSRMQIGRIVYRHRHSSGG